MDINGRKRTSNLLTTLVTKKRNQSNILTESNENDVVATVEDMKNFFELLEDKLIAKFLMRDTCYKLVDKYLLAMVFVYFQRARVKKKNYSRLSFFVGLFLAHDMEEDEEDIKFEIFPWILGKNWQMKYPKFLLLRDKLWSTMDHRAVVSKRCCLEVFSIEPDHPLWKRERFQHHSGCCRNLIYDKPRGPEKSPLMCEQCIAQHLYSVPTVYDSLIYLPDCKENFPLPSISEDNEKDDKAVLRDKRRVFRFIVYNYIAIAPEDITLMWSDELSQSDIQEVILQSEAGAEQEGHRHADRGGADSRA
uniref:Speedy protein A n=1 Tax=Strigamia maritima TaxID=126957 RepID=T1IPZ2_STRMM